jgi:transcriptional regulator with XRE-family HTH domain
MQCFKSKQSLSLQLKEKNKLMNLKLTKKQLGQRITALRKAKGLSQEDLAKLIELSRPSLAQIELGNRSIDALELFRLSQVLGFSMDELMSEDYTEEESVVREEEMAYKKQELRISLPELQVSKLMNVLLYILEACAGKPNIGETALNKLLYFCDFNYYELYEEHLTGARYKKLPYGPVPQKIDAIINQMIKEGQLQRIRTEYHGLPQTRYLPLEKADLTRLSATEKTVIDHVIQQMSDWNASWISEYSHKDMPWLATKDGDYISYNLAFYRELPYSIRVYDDENPEE